MATNQDPQTTQPQSGNQLATSTAAAATPGNAPDIDKSIPVSNRKAWHAQVSQNARNFVVEKLVEATFPTPDPAALRDSRMSNLFVYARKIEDEKYESANNWGEYIHSLTETIYKIKNQLKEKRIQRMRQNPQIAQVSGMQEADSVRDTEWFKELRYVQRPE